MRNLLPLLLLLLTGEAAVLQLSGEVPEFLAPSFTICCADLLMCVQTLCKAEAANRPCPRIVLVCCTALVTGGLSAEGLFQQEASEDLVHFLFGAFDEGRPLKPSHISVPCPSNVRSPTH